MADGSRIRVRMYRQGLGDCLLLSLLRQGGKPFHVMFDCGVILGTPNAGSILNTVVADIAAETGGQVDVLVVTHEHYDHVAGFKLAADRFAPAGQGGGDRVSFGEVWYAWTEEPDNADADALRKDRDKRVRTLAQSSSQLALGADTAALAPMLAGALSFFGVSPDGKGVGDTTQAMRFPATLVDKDSIRYLRPGQVLHPAAAPELRIFVLGPPTDRASLMKTDSVPEVYHLDDGEEPPDLALDESQRPFDSTWSANLAELGGEHPPSGSLGDFFRSRYFGVQPSTPVTDVGWRRIDGEWLAGTEQLALALHSATNNTSVALAVELVATGEVLLFPADAQVGNWLSWHKLQWEVGGKEVTTPDLLARTVFYKVGHHGSGNATLKAKGLEMMSHKDLVAFVPVDGKMAQQKGWGRMPLESLMADLHARCGNRVVRIDDAALAKGVAGLRAGGKGGPYASLYYEWTAPLRGAP